MIGDLEVFDDFEVQLSRQAKERRCRARVCHGGFDRSADLVGVLVFEVVSISRREARTTIRENTFI